MKVCYVEKCNNNGLAKGYCRTHYMQLSRYGKILEYHCKERTFQALGKRDKPCCIDGCENKSSAKGMCSMHYTRDRKHGSPMICYSKPKKPEMESLMREERRYRLSGDEKELLSEMFKESVGMNEGETVMNYD